MTTTIKNNVEEKLKEANEHIKQKFPSMKYDVVIGVIGFLLIFYVSDGFLHWFGILLLGLIFVDFFRREGYIKGFVDGYDVGAEDASPDSSEFKEWLSETEDEESI